ncbi:hypothetical protein D9M72_515840 [compost metagenome]
MQAADHRLGDLVQRLEHHRQPRRFGDAGRPIGIELLTHPAEIAAGAEAAALGFQYDGPDRAIVRKRMSGFGQFADHLRRQCVVLLRLCQRQPRDAACVGRDPDRFEGHDLVLKVRAKAAACSSFAVSRPVENPLPVTKALTASVSTLPAAPGA